jgi:hypothetical protein
MSAVDDRRQRAREAFWDNGNEDPATLPAAVEAAVETATRVQITPEVIRDFGEAWHARGESRVPCAPGDRRRAGLTAALRALGFEVVE